MATAAKRSARVISAHTRTTSKPTIGGQRARDGVYDHITDIQPTNERLRAFARDHGLMDLVVIDRPWAYGKIRPKAEHYGEPSREYPCIIDQELMKLEIRAITKPNAIVAEWCPVSQIGFLLDIWRKQGIAYRTMITWAKLGSRGSLFSNAASGAALPMTEMLVIGARGRGLMLSTDVEKIERLLGVFFAPVGRHSEKPQWVHDQLAQVYGVRAACKAELFAREQKRGWHVWGNQSDGRHAKRARRAAA
jgi:N6-adenosine-specific RNA methylase IME4